VHALRHVHELLVPGGTLVDMHPVTQEQVETPEGPIGVIEEPEWISVDLPNTEARLRESIRAGLYALEAETEYDVLQHFDEVDDLIEAKRDLLEGQASLVRRIKKATPPLVTREHIVLRRLSARPT
jgi:hypothetical protein